MSANEASAGRRSGRLASALSLSSFNRNRMDEAQPNEDATAGEWIQYIEFWPADSYPGFERLVFAAVASPTNN